MASIRQEILIEATPEQVWAAVRDVGAVHLRLVPGQVVDTGLEGDTRTLTFANGAVVRELIVAVDDEARRPGLCGGRGAHAAPASPCLVPGVSRWRGPQPARLDHRCAPARACRGSPPAWSSGEQPL